MTATSSAEPSEDRDVLDAEPAGESKGEAVAEFAYEEGTESVVTVLFIIGFWGRAVVAILRWCEGLLVAIQGARFRQRRINCQPREGRRNGVS